MDNIQELTICASCQIGAEDVKGESSIRLIEGENRRVEDGVDARTANHFGHHVFQHAEKGKIDQKPREATLRR